MNRRGFISGLTGLLCAPALVRASSLDAVPRGVAIYGRAGVFELPAGLQSGDLLVFSTILDPIPGGYYVMRNGSAVCGPQIFGA